MKFMRFCVVVSMLVVMLIVSSTLVYAESDGVLVDELDTLDVPDLPTSDEYSKAWVYRLPNNQYFCVCHTEETSIDFTLLSNGDYSYFLVSFQRYVYTVGTDEWVFYDEGWAQDIALYQDYYGVTSSGAILDYLVEYTYYTDVPLYDKTNEVFFCQPRMMETTLTVGQLTGPELTTLTMTEIRGLVPLVLGFLTLAIALWKGWTMLRRALAGA